MIAQYPTQVAELFTTEEKMMKMLTAQPQEKFFVQAGTDPFLVDTSSLQEGVMKILIISDYSPAEMHGIATHVKNLVGQLVGNARNFHTREDSRWAAGMRENIFFQI